MNNYKEQDIYEQNYTYEHLKIACVVQDYIINHRYEFKEDIVYEDIAKMTLEIYDEWLREEKNKTLSEEEFAYIQAYAYRYLEEYFEGERKWELTELK